jgi:hypothetical protein
MIDVETEEDELTSAPFNALHLLPEVSGIYCAKNKNEDALSVGSTQLTEALTAAAHALCSARWMHQDRLGRVRA